MEFLGQVKSSFIDYPGRICAVYFTGGCNFRCPYCHNSHLLEGKGESIDEAQVFRHLEKRRNALDGGDTGREPTYRSTGALLRSKAGVFLFAGYERTVSKR